MIFQSQGLERPLRKLKSFYLPFKNSFGHKIIRLATHLDWFLPIRACHKILQITSSLSKSLRSKRMGAYKLAKWAPSRKVMWSFNNVVLQNHVVNWNYYIFLLKVPMTTKLNRMSTQLDCLLAIKLLEALINLSCKMKSQTKAIKALLPQWLLKWKKRSC